MRSRAVIASVERSMYVAKHAETIAASVQHEHYAKTTAMEYIADEAGHADIATIKRLANITLGRA